MSVEQSEGLEKNSWHMQGRVTLRGEMHLRKARKRMIRILTKCHGKLALPLDVNSAFANMLATTIRENGRGTIVGRTKTIWWTPEML